MKEAVKRSISGIVYIAIMWIGTSFSNLTFHTLFVIISVICIREMLELTKGKKKILPFLYISIPLIIIHLIGNENERRKIILFMFILTWTFDTFAYITGVPFGKHKIIEKVSPKKSWEGFIGGTIFTFLATWLIYNINLLNTYFFTHLDSVQIIIITVLIPITATIGDLIESYYKRSAGLKDSGNFIPGHGGMLDRMDAFMITIPTIFIITKIL